MQRLLHGLLHQLLHQVLHRLQHDGCLEHPAKNTNMPCKVGLYMSCIKCCLGHTPIVSMTPIASMTPHCKHDHSTVSPSMSPSMIPTMIPTMIISHEQQTLVCDLGTKTRLNDSSSVVHDLVLHFLSAWATCACSALLHPKPVGAHHKSQLVFESHVRHKCTMQQTCINTIAGPPLQPFVTASVTGMTLQQ